MTFFCRLAILVATTCTHSLAMFFIYCWSLNRFEPGYHDDGCDNKIEYHRIRKTKTNPLNPKWGMYLYMA
jgi:hypothetical protein